MNDAFVNKGLQRSVNGNAVKMLATQPFNISMRKRFLVCRKHFKNSQPVIGNAKLAMF
jgi:hypothetical protein